MKIIIKETSIEEYLEIIDPRTGINWISDFIGNTGALSDGQFVWDDEKDAYICDQDTFDWWSKVVYDNESIENRVYELCKKHGSDAVSEVVYGVGNVDLDQLAASVNDALNEAFCEN